MATCPTCGTEVLAGQQNCSSCGSPTSSVYLKPAPLPNFPGETASPSDIRLAGFWTRFLGWAIDYLIILLVVQLPLSAANADFATSLAIWMVITFLYGSLFIGLSHGRTIGMRVVSIKCVDEDGVTELNYPRAAKRSFAYGVLFLIGNIYHFQRYVHPTAIQLHREDHHLLIYLAFYVPHLVDLLWVSWDNKNQTLHDKFAHTIVIKTK